MTGPAVVIVTVAGELPTIPAKFATATVYTPASAGWTLDRASVALVAPGRRVPFLRHWYVGAGLPVAATESVTVLPTFTDWLAGWIVMAGAEEAVSVMTKPISVGPNVSPETFGFS